jgi:hypothetical protein
MAESWRFELTLSELRAVCSLVPELVLPAGYTMSDLAKEGTTVDGDEALKAGLASLTRRGLLSREVDGDKENVSPALLFALSLHVVAEHAIRLFSWSPSDEVREVVSVNRGACAGLRRILPRGAQAGDSSTRIIVTFMYLSELPRHLLELVAEGPQVAKAALQATTIGLVESRAVLEAIRSGDQEFLEGLTGRLNTETDVELMSGLTRQMDAGFHLELLDQDARCLYIGDWFRGDDDWMSMTVMPDRFPVSGQSIAESGRMRLAKVTRALIRIDLIELVAGIRRARDVA